MLSFLALRPCDKNGKSDPYVNVDIHPATSVQNKAERKFKTSIKCDRAFSATSAPHLSLRLFVLHAGRKRLIRCTTKRLAQCRLMVRKSSSLSVRGQHPIAPAVTVACWSPKTPTHSSLPYIVKDWNFMSKSDVCGTARLRLGDVEALKSGLPQRQTVKLTEQGVLVLDIEFVDGQVSFGC